MDIDEAIKYLETSWIDNDPETAVESDFAIRAVLDELAAYKEMYGEASVIELDRVNEFSLRKTLGGNWRGYRTVSLGRQSLTESHASALDAYRAMKEKV